MDGAAARIVAATVAPTPTLLALLVIIAFGLAAVAAQLWVRGRAIRRVERRRTQALPPCDPPGPLDLAIAARFVARRSETSANEAENLALLLADGRDAFVARAASAADARRSLDLMYYAWSGDPIGRLLYAQVLDAAERGVRVRLLIDDFNAEGADALLLALDRHPNIEVRIHNPLLVRAGLARVVELLMRFARVNHRMHNKCWIADARIAVVGGRNIEDRYFDAAAAVNFRDLDMLVAGPAVAQASAIFDGFWNHPTACPLGALAFAFPRRVEDAQAAILGARDLPETQAQMAALAATPSVESLLSRLPPPRWTAALDIRSDPPAKWRAARMRADWIATHLWKWLREARRDAQIVSPYFVPRRRFSAQLVRLARRDRIEVEVVTNSLAANDVAAVHGGYMRYRRKLLRAGVKLYEVRAQPGDEDERSVFGSSGASLHTKAALFDGRRGFVGSFNMDPRSARVNSEMGVFFEDEALAKDLRAEIERLKEPALSYVVGLSDGRLFWLDRRGDPPLRLDDEPQSTFAQRMVARLAGWLPIEQEL